MSIRFTPEDVRQFAAWSCDRNPLHTDAEAARGTHFGQTVVHGILTAIATLREAAAAVDGPVRELELQFRSAAFPTIEYESASRRDGADAVAELVDGTAQRVVVAVMRSIGVEPEPDRDWSWVAQADRRPVRAAAAVHDLDAFERGLTSTGLYALGPTPAAWQSIPGVCDTNVRVLALCSYVIGMEIPGVKSLFTRANVRFLSATDASTALIYRARTGRFDRELRLLTIELDVAAADGAPVATAVLQSYVPFSPAPVDIPGLAARLAPATARLRDKVAVVIGARGGLGGEISAALALAGCHVHAVARTDDDQRRAQHAQIAAQGGTIELLQGDAGDFAWCNEALASIRARHGRIDLLVLNACAPPPTLRLGPAAAGLHAAYVTDNLKLIHGPLAAAAHALDEHSGAVVFVSSVAVEKPPPGWSHYVAVKQAGEGLVRTTGREHANLFTLIVRPPALQTRWNDTPARAAGAMASDLAATHIVNQLAETWQAGRHETVTEFPRVVRAAAVASQSTPARPPAFTIRLAASFTADAVKASIAAWTDTLALDDVAVALAPYGQQLQQLLDPASLLNSRGRGVNVLLLRVADWLRELPAEQVNDIELVRAHLQRMVADVDGALRAHRTLATAETVLLMCPSLGARSSAESIVIGQAESDLTARLSGVAGVEVMAASNHHAVYDVVEDEIHDALRDDIAHIPYRDGYLQVLATVVARRAYRALTPARKVVVVDCDNTLWRGVVGEVGAEGVELDSSHRALQTALTRLIARGVLVCLCSKNEEDDVWRVFDSRTDMILRREHVVAAAINWLPKSQNLRQLARRLNLGLDSFVFVDDNPVECAEVRAGCPEVLTVQWPERPADAERLLRHFWELDAGKSTSEDARRTQLYHEEFRRQDARTETTTFADFIEKLNLVVDVRSLAEDDVRRAAQLTLRTNQFNFTTIRRDEAELRALTADGQHIVQTIRVHDRFGDYGLVGLVIVDCRGEAWQLDTFLLSCRVLGRGVEHQIMAAVGRMAVEAQARTVGIRIVTTPRNQPARAFLEGIVDRDALNATGEGVACGLPPATLAAVRFEPRTAAELVIEEDAAPQSPRQIDHDRLRRREAQMADSIASPLVGTDRRASAGGGRAAAADATLDIGDVVRDAFARALRVSPDTVAAVDQLEALGCDSLRIVEITVALSERFPWLPRTLLFEHRSVSEIVAEIARESGRGEPAPAVMPAERAARPAPARVRDVAVVGMDLRTAGADSPAALWDLLANGRSAVRPVPADRPQFVQPLLDSRPHWAGLLDQVEAFDAEFFGVSAREAEFLDPQLRLFLEVAWGALEDAGCLGADHDPQTGVFAGVMYADYGFRANLASRGTSNPYKTWEGFGLANRLSQLLDFHGPSLAVDTACSSSGTALHLACAALAAGDCRVALVGGVNLILDPDRLAALGRLGILSSRGRCEPFGADADGTVLGEGAGVVVLRLLDEALERGDRIYGVIKGTGLSTGSGTVGFTAPNPQSQSEAIRRAVDAAGIDPRTITYVETHGTGTALGDPIEIRGLTLGYGGADAANGDPAAPCAVGSIKPNIGHLEAGAGALGLIKVLLQFQHGQRLPSLTSAQPNPQIPFEQSRFVVQRELAEWPRPRTIVDGRTVDVPRRAGVSSFGVGGANAHAIVEEAPRTSASSPGARRARHVLALSGRSAAALRRQAASVLEFQSDRPDVSVADLCHSLNTGRQHFTHRMAIAAGDREELARQLQRSLAGPPVAPAPRPRVAFLFTGQGSQYAGMGRGLYESEPIFRAELDRCAAILDAMLDRPLLQLLFAGEGTPDAALLDQTGYTQPALFAIEYALATLWQHWGVTPDVVLGHSVGEIAAMCFADGMSLEDGLTLVAARGRLMQALPAGGVMTSVMADESRVLEAIAGSEDRVAIAAVNTPGQVVISGAGTAVAEIAARLTADGIKTTALTVSHAFHSPLMRPMLADYHRVVRGITLRTPRLPFVSGVDGEVVSDELTSPEYWVRQVLEPVRFAAGMRRLGADGVNTCIEVGPHPVLLGMGRQCLADGDGVAWLPSLRRHADDTQTLTDSVAALYQRGGAIDWRAFDRPGAPRRVSAPTYPFERRHYWLKSLPAFETTAAPPSLDPSIYEVRWTTVAAPAAAATAAHWVLFLDRGGVGESLAALLRQSNPAVTTVVRGRAFAAAGPHAFAIDPHAAGDYERLWRTIADGSSVPVRAVYLWALDASGTTNEADATGDLVAHAAALVRAVAAGGRDDRAIWAVTRGAVSIDATRSAEPVPLAAAALWGFGRTAVLEYPSIWGGLIDIPGLPPDEAARALSRELTGSGDDDQIALTNGGRFAARLARRGDAPSQRKALTADGVYVITGGTGALGLHAAEWLVEAGARQIVIASRRGSLDAPARARVESLQTRGATITTVAADVSLRADVERLIAAADEHGPLRGIVHAAGVDSVQPIAEMSADRVQETFAAKALGAWWLHDCTRRRQLDLFITFSSMSAVLGAQSRAAYAAANAWLDGLVAERRRLGLAATSVAWGPWRGGGMATADTLQQFERIGNRGLDPDAARLALDRVVASGVAHAVVADIDWDLFRPAFEARRPRPIVSEVDGAAAPASSAPGAVAPWVEQLRALAPEQREPELAALLAREVAQTLGFDDETSVPADRSFYEIGVDSLMMADLVSRLRRQVGVSCSSLVFNHPNVNALAGRMLDAISFESAAASIQPPAPMSLAAATEAEILAFQPGAFPDRTLDLIEPRWRWMFVDSARRLQVEPRLWIHREQGRIVGQMGSIPVKLLVNGQERPTGWLVETMVLEAYRHLAIGSRLMVEAHEDQPFSLSLGQTAEMREIQAHLGWIEVAPLQIAQLLLRPEKVLKGKLPAAAAWAAGLGARATSAVREWRKDGPTYSVRSIDRFDRPHDALWAEMSRDLTCAVVRDASYLNWKYVDQPGQRFVRLEVRDGDELIGIAVWMLREPDSVYLYRRAFLVELVAPLSRDAALRQIMRSVCAEASRWDADALLCHHIDDRLTGALRANGFHLRRPQRFLLVDPGGLSDDMRSAVASGRNWYVTHGDSDIDRPS